MVQRFMKVSGAGLRAAVALPLAAVALDIASAQTAQTAGREQSLEVSLNTGVSWSDNIERASAAEQDGEIGEAGMSLAYAQRGARLRSQLDADVAYQHYFEDTFADDVVGGMQGMLLADIVPERLSWLVQDNFGQISSDPFAADTPDNREHINYLTTGPDVSLRLGNALSVALSGRYSHTAYETSQLDSERYSGSLSLIRQLSSASALSLIASQERVTFEETTLNPEYDQAQAFVRYNLQAPRTTFSADLGTTQVDIASRTSEGLLARIALSRRLSAAPTLTLGAGTQFSDAGDLFRATQTQQGVQRDAVSVLASSDPFQSRFASAGWDFSRNRTMMGLSVQYGQEEYETLTVNDRTLTTYAGYFSRQMSRYAQLRLYGRFDEEQFDSVSFVDQEMQVGAALSINMGSTLQLRLQFDHYDRQSTAPQSEYRENRASVFATWSPLGQR